MKNTSMISKYLLARNKQPSQRLQYPQVTQQRKHFQYHKPDQVKLGNQQTDFFAKSAKRNNNLDVSNIDGAQPRRSHRTKSEKSIHYNPASIDNGEVKDVLDNLTKSGLHKRQFSMKQLAQVFPSKQKDRQKSIGPLHALQTRKIQLKNARDLNKPLKTEPTSIDYSNSELNKYNIVQKHKEKGHNLEQNKSILRNPTYLSSLFFA